MKSLRFKKSQVTVTIAIAILIGAITATVQYKTNYKIPLKQYTASCLYIAVMDDEIARNTFENVLVNEKEVLFPSPRESLQYRYHLHLALQKGKTLSQLDEEIATYETLLAESRSFVAEKTSSTNPL